METETLLQPETLSLIAAIGGLVGAIGGVFAAFAAFRAAGAAKAAVKQGAELERRRLVGQVVQAAQEVVAEHMRMTEVAPDLKLAYQTLSTFSGGSGSSRLKMYQDSVDKKVEESAPLKDEAGEFFTDLKARSDLSDEELTTALHRFNGYSTQLRVTNEGLRKELASIERQNTTFREKAISGLPR